MIATAIRTPRPSAEIVATNSETRLAWCRTPDDDMTSLLGAPRASAAPKITINRAFGPGPWRLFIVGQCWGVMVNKWLIDIREACRPRLEDAPLDRESCAARHTSFRPKSRNSASPHCPPRRQGMAPGATPFSGERADQNVQPSAVSEAFVASSVCLQVASMVAFVEDSSPCRPMSCVWSICVLYIARCASGTLETTQASYLVRKSSQGRSPCSGREPW